MKRIRLLLSIWLACLFSVACGAGNPQGDLKVYHAKQGSLVNPEFPAYTFEYPSTWKIQEAANHITFASEAKLLKDAPDQLSPGQIIAGLSMSANMSPGDMIDSYRSTLGSTLQFDPMTSMIVNGHSAAYQSGRDVKTGDQTFVIAADLGQNVRGLLTARVAGGEADMWKETLFRIVQSLQVEQ